MTIIALALLWIGTIGVILWIAYNGGKDNPTW